MNIVGSYLIPGLMVVPFLISLVIAFFVPSKNSSVGRRTGYYASSLSKIVLIHSIIMIVIGLMLLLLYFIASDLFIPEFFILNTALYLLGGTGLTVLGFRATRLSRRTALSGSVDRKGFSFSPVRNEDKVEEPVVFECMDVEPIE